MKERDHLGGQREGLASATLSYIKKMCCALFSLASPFLLLFLSFSLPLSFPLSWPFYSLKRYREGGGGEERGMRDGRKEGELFYPLLSVSPVPAEQKHKIYRSCARVCLAKNINDHAHTFTHESAANN